MIDLIEDHYLIGYSTRFSIYDYSHHSLAAQIKIKCEKKKLHLNQSHIVIQDKTGIKELKHIDPKVNGSILSDLS